MTGPTVAIVGRMNVGKSTLFNRLTESRHAITSSWPGTTRDVNMGQVLWRGMEFTLVDTGGLDVKDDAELEERVIAAAHRAAAAADIVLFVIDGRAGVLPQDRELAKELNATGKPMILAVNKVDNAKTERELDGEIFKLNIDPVFFVAASSGRGSGDLLDGIYDRIKTRLQEPELPEERTRVAIVGRPNVGKSSLLNAIIGEDRVIVSEAAHTTRDTNDIPYEYDGKKFLLIDTAGIRRRTKVGTAWSDARLGQIEKQSVDAAIFAMQRADVVLLVLEAQHRITVQDKKIAALAEEFGKGLVLVLNKWDLIEEKDSNTINEFRDYFDQALPFLRWAPMAFVSATDKLRVAETLDLVKRVGDNFRRELTPEELAPILYSVSGKYNPRQSRTRKYRKKIVKFKSLTQVANQPPRFKLGVDRPKEVPTAIPHQIERELRARYDFEGVKIIIETDQE